MFGVEEHGDDGRGQAGAGSQGRQSRRRLTQCVGGAPIGFIANPVNPYVVAGHRAE